MAAILKNGRRYSFSNGLSGKFNLKASKNIPRKCHACMIMRKRVPLLARLYLLLQI